MEPVVQVPGEFAAPIIITHKTVHKLPKVETKKQFVGFMNGVKGILYNVLDFIDKSFYEETRKIIDPGQISSVSYAIDVQGDRENPHLNEVVVTRLDGSSRPATGMHFEVYKSPVSVPHLQEKELPEHSRAKKAFERPRKDSM